MNTIKSLIAILFAAFMTVSCSKEEQKSPYLEVTANNISGQWKLVEWNGAPLSQDTYFYVEFVRKDCKFTIYQNFDSMGDMPHVVTGEYNIEIDLESGAIIRGMYDYDGGFWSHRYEIDDLTEDSMVWTAVDDPGFVQKFVRTDIPDQVRK